MATQRRAARHTFERVRKMGLELPDAEVSPYFGAPALKVNGTMFACMASHSSAEAGSLVVRVPIPDRDELIAADPDVYYLTDHYVDYPSVLVRLAKVEDAVLRDLLLMGWQSARAAKPGKRRLSGRKR